MWIENNSKYKGFTLLEVLLALLITCSLLTLSLRLLADQWRAAKEIKDRQEIQYALLTAGETVSTAIRSAQKIQWISPGVLKIIPWSESIDYPKVSYYIADKDNDGILDLYREHSSADPYPIVSRITALQCMEVEPGLWQVTFQASMNHQQATWQALIRRRS